MGALDFLEAENLTCIRGGRLVFRDLSFRARAGGVLAIEGPNGAGKTSLLRMIAGFLAPAAGTIRMGGDSVDAGERGRFVGWLGHQDAAKPQMTVRETLRFFARLYRGAAVAEDELSAAEGEVGLARCRDLPCQYLSAGQKKRLALARLTLLRRPLWLLDEPLAALDTDAKALVPRMIETHRTAGGIAIAATHEPLGIDCVKLVLGGAA